MQRFIIGLLVEILNYIGIGFLMGIGACGAVYLLGNF